MVFSIHRDIVGLAAGIGVSLPAACFNQIYIDCSPRFLIFPSAYIQTYNSTVSPYSALGAALALIGLSTVTSLVLGFFIKSWIFHLDILYIPHLTSSILGLLNTTYTFVSHHGVAGSKTPAAHHAITALVVSIVVTLMYGSLSLYTFRKVYMVRARDALHRHTLPTATPEYLPETEQQRKQLLRLLLQQEESQTSSPDMTASQTFKIDWPGSNNMSTDRSRRNTLNSFRNFPRLGGGTSRRSTILGGDPAESLPGGIERVPTVIREESTLGSNGDRDANRPENTQSNDPTALRPALLAPRANSALFNTTAADEQSRAPSYCENAHPSMNLDVVPVNRPSLGDNGYPIEKPQAQAQVQARDSHDDVVIEEKQHEVLRPDIKVTEHGSQDLGIEPGMAF